MYRFFGRLVVGMSALFFAAAAHAQGTAASASSERPFKLGGVFGATVPIGDFSDIVDLGFHFGGLIEYKPKSVPVNLRGELTYHRNGVSSDSKFGPGSGVDVGDGSASTFGVVGNVFFPFGDPASTARPYAIGGLGVYRVSISRDVEGSNGSYNTTDTNLGLNLGGGFTFNLSGFETFVEARFHSVFTDVKNTNFIPLSFGFKF